MDESAPSLPTPGEPPAFVPPGAADAPPPPAPVAPGFAAPVLPGTAAAPSPFAPAASPSPAPALAAPQVPVSAPAFAPASPSAPPTIPAFAPAPPAAPGGAPQYPSMPAAATAGFDPTTTPPESGAPLQPTSAPKRTKGLLIGSLAALTAVSVAAGAFILTRTNSTDSIIDDSIEVITDTEQSGEAYSFAAATTNVSEARSVTVDMTVDTPDGLMSMTAAMDSGTSRMSLTIDMSELDSSGLDMADEMQMILDESSGLAYVGGGFYDTWFDFDAEWISMDLSEFGSDTGEISGMFTDPLATTATFDGLDPVDLGIETIDGESLHHYQVLVDAATIAASVESADLWSDVANATDVTFDVWVSEDNQIRRMRFEVDELGERATIDMWIDVSPTALDIALPDPSQVTSIEEIIAEWSGDLELDFELEQEMPVDIETTED